MAKGKLLTFDELASIALTAADLSDACELAAKAIEGCKAERIEKPLELVARLQNAIQAAGKLSNRLIMADAMQKQADRIEALEARRSA